MQYADIVHRCFRCGYCKFTSDFRDLNCPTYSKFNFESYSPGGRLWLINGWLKKDIQWTEHLADIIYSCTTCRNCVDKCVFKFKDYLVEIVVAARQEMVEQGLVPPTVRDYLKNIQLYGNPYKAPPADRGKWAEGSGMGLYDGNEYLFYVGCVGSYDERGRRIAHSLAGLFARAGLSAGILGSEEVCDGNEVRLLGELSLFEYLAETNTTRYNKAGVNKVVTLSPHSYNVMKNFYPNYGAGFSVFHYTQLLWDLLKDKKLKPGKVDLKVTYHDPCYLGRHNDEYNTPRRVLQAVPGLKLIEMEKNRKDALCCGGGGGNFFTDIIGSGTNSPAAVRVREAASTGAEVLAVACPNCAKMFDDAVKAEGLEGRLKVKDIAELLSEACN